MVECRQAGVGGMDTPGIMKAGIFQKSGNATMGWRSRFKGSIFLRHGRRFLQADFGWVEISGQVLAPRRRHSASKMIAVSAYRTSATGQKGLKLTLRPKVKPGTPPWGRWSDWLGRAQPADLVDA